MYPFRPFQSCRVRRLRAGTWLWQRRRKTTRHCRVSQSLLAIEVERQGIRTVLRCRAKPINHQHHGCLTLKSRWGVLGELRGGIYAIVPLRWINLMKNCNSRCSSLRHKTCQSTRLIWNDPELTVPRSTERSSSRRQASIRGRVGSEGPELAWIQSRVAERPRSKHLIALQWHATSSAIITWARCSSKASICTRESIKSSRTRKLYINAYIAVSFSHKDHNSSSNLSKAQQCN